MSSSTVKSFTQRLEDGDNIIVAEGYLFNFERRGYLRAGCYTPEVNLEHPELVRLLYEEFVHAGSDVVQAFTYYGHREKMNLVGRGDETEKLNRKALKMAREVADKTGTLMAGNICNTNIFVPGDDACIGEIKEMFKEQILWAVEEKADFIIGETFWSLGEAQLALEGIKEHGSGLPAVITLGALAKTLRGGMQITDDGFELAEACKTLEDAGAAVVGLNCVRGPSTMLPLMENICKVCKGPIAALPVPYRTTPEEPTFLCLHDRDDPKKLLFPRNDLDCALCSRSDIEHFAKRCKEIGIQYVGICCGNAGHYTRTLAETLGRKPPASRYSPNMSQHFAFGDNSTPSLKEYMIKEFVKKM